MVTKFAAADGALTLRSNEEGWCTVDLTLLDKTVFLGAEAREWVLERLEAALKKPLAAQPSGVHEGLQLVPVMSLSEAHGSVYAADRDGDRVFFFQDASAVWLGRIVLTDDERERWRSQLNTKKESQKTGS